MEGIGKRGKLINIYIIFQIFDTLWKSIACFVNRAFTNIQKACGTSFLKLFNKFWFEWFADIGAVDSQSQQ